MSDFFFSETRKRSRRVQDDIYVFFNAHTNDTYVYIFTKALCRIYYSK